MTRFGVLGAQHGHVFDITDLLIGAGAQPTHFFEPDARFANRYHERFPQIPAATSERDLLDDPSIDLLVIVSEPARRASLAVEAMRRGKDVVLDKPAVASREGLANLRAAQRETGRIVSIFFNEHLADRVTLKALDLVRGGAIGEVVHVTSLSPHKIGSARRADWFYESERYGGIVNDLLIHHVHQFMLFTGSEQIHIEHARASNLAHPEYPHFEDLGDLLLASDHATGYARADWFTPIDLPTWGDVRIFVTGTRGSLELRKNLDVGGSGRAGRLYWMDGGRIEAIDCADVPIRYGEQLLHDLAGRTETVMAQEHTFHVCELTLDAVDLAHRSHSERNTQLPT